MAIVSNKGNVILIGGIEKDQTSTSVVMYDVKTGKIKCYLVLIIKEQDVQQLSLAM